MNIASIAELSDRSSIIELNETIQGRIQAYTTKGLEDHGLNIIIIK